MNQRHVTDIEVNREKYNKADIDTKDAHFRGKIQKVPIEI